MNRATIALAVVLLLLPSGKATGQISASSKFLEQAGVLQNNLAKWRQKLSNPVHGPGPPLSNAEKQLLRSDRSTCLKWISTLDTDIRRIETASTPEGEARVVLDAEHLQGAVANMDYLLRPAVLLRIMSPLERSSDNLNYQLFRQLNAKVSARKPRKPCVISGYVYRADTGKPLAGAKVMLGLTSSLGPPLRSVETKADGSYAFSNVPPGQYRVGAYLKAFTHGQYGPTNHIGAEWTTINLASGQKAGGIDMRLHPLVSVTQMNEEALVAAFGGGRFWLQIWLGYFSPDGKLFAFTVGDPDEHQVWLYDMSSARLTPVTQKPLAGWPQIRGMAWIGETLYVDAYGPVHTRYFEATAEGIRRISKLPPAAQTAVKQSRLRASNIGRNDRFVVTANTPCNNCSVHLKVTSPQGCEKFHMSIGTPGWFVFERRRSVVLFPVSYYPAIAALDLSTRRIRETYLPKRAELLLDAKPEPGGYLAAYSSYGPCRGYGDKGGLYPIRLTGAPQNVCFATIPFRTKK